MPTPVSTPRGLVPLDRVIPALLAAPHPCDKRKGRDLAVVLDACRATWRERVVPLGLLPAEGGTALLAVFALRADGLVFSNGAPAAYDQFSLAILIPEHYPLAMPFVVFSDPLPFSPHVFDTRFKPPAQGAPPEFHEFLQRGNGCCCFVRHGQWTADCTHDLALLLWILSRIVTGNLMWGEATALNPRARDHFLRLKEQGRLPLGPALPLPESHAAAIGGTPLSGQQESSSDPDIEWSEEQ